jgi:Tol biopolymer transport system component
VLHQFNRIRSVTPLRAIVLAGLFTVVGSTVSAQSQSVSHKANGKIAFVSNRDGAEKIYLINPDGSGLVKLTDGPHHLQPSWSPDGTQIAFMGLDKEATALFTMNSDATQRKLIATNIFHNVSLAWSPDGSKIAFVSVAPDAAASSKFSVHVIDADGTHDKRLANGSGSIAWSPDGKQLAIATFSGIDLVNADGTDSRTLAHMTSRFPQNLSWSPDGSSILFGATRPSTDPHARGTLRYSIEMIAADGNAGNDSKLLGYGSDATWSPDGSKIVFVRSTAGSAATQVWVMDADGRKPVQITDVGPNWRPSWQPLLTASSN